MEKQIKEIINESNEHADKEGIKLNPNENIVQGVVKGLIRNKEKHGEFYCPCRFVTGDKEKDKEIICPCVFHLKEIEKDGKCHCGLFVKK